jgi:hypothetical protein
MQVPAIAVQKMSSGYKQAAVCQWPKVEISEVWPGKEWIGSEGESVEGVSQVEDGHQIAC